MGRFSWSAVVVMAACGGSSTTPAKQPVLTNTTTAASEQSRNDVVKEALAALASGDVDRLMALADPKGLYEYGFACKQDREDDELADSKRLETSLRDDFTKAADKVKGAKVDVVSIRNEMRRSPRRYGGDRDRNATFIAKGGTVSSACVARTDLVFHEVEVRVRVSNHAGTNNGNAKESKAKLEMILAKGRWYVVKVPKDLAAGSGADGAVAKMEEFQKRMCDCKDKACADTVNEDMTKWGTEMARNASYDHDERPDPDLARKSADIMTKYTECMTKLMMAGAGGTP